MPPTLRPFIAYFAASMRLESAERRPNIAVSNVRYLRTENFAESTCIILIYYAAMTRNIFPLLHLLMLLLLQQRE